MTPPVRRSVRQAVEKTIETVYCRAYRSTGQDNLNGDEWNKINLNAVDSNGSTFDTTNSRFVAPVAGLYEIVASLSLSSIVADKRYILGLYKNGSAIRTVSQHSALAANLTISCVDQLFLRANDYVELYGYPEVGGATDTVDVVTGLTGTVLIARLTTKEGIRQ